jgi:hypothetical protein
MRLLLFFLILEAFTLGHFKHPHSESFLRIYNPFPSDFGHALFNDSIAHEDQVDDIHRDDEVVVDEPRDEDLFACYVLGHRQNIHRNYQIADLVETLDVVQSLFLKVLHVQIVTT